MEENKLNKVEIIRKNKKTSIKIPMFEIKMAIDEKTSSITI